MSPRANVQPDQDPEENEENVFLNLPGPDEPCLTAAAARFRTAAGADLLNRALVAIRKAKRVSVSILQRRLKLGYNEASAVMEELEAAGFVGPPVGEEPRELCMDRFEQGLRFGASLSAEEAEELEPAPAPFALQVLPKRVDGDDEEEAPGGDDLRERWRKIQQELGAGSALAEMYAVPEDELGLKALEMAAKLEFPGEPVDTMMDRLLCAVFLEFSMRNGGYIKDAFRRDLSKFLMEGEDAPADFAFRVPCEIILKCGNGGEGVYPSLVSKLGCAKIKARTRNAVACQLELF